MSSACISARTPPTATTVFIYDAYTLRRTVVRALGHAAAFAAASRSERSASSSARSRSAVRAGDAARRAFPL